MTSFRLRKEDWNSGSKKSAAFTISTDYIDHRRRPLTPPYRHVRCVWSRSIQSEIGWQLLEGNALMGLLRSSTFELVYT